MGIWPQPRALTAAAIGAVIVLAGLGWYLLREPVPLPPAADDTVVEMPAPRETPPEPPPPPPPPPPPARIEPGPDPFVLPPLDGADAVVRELVATLSAHPRFAAWLVPDDLVRRFVVAVDAVANRNNPAQHLPFMRPESRFRTEGATPSLRIAPASHARYDTLRSIVGSIDVQGAAALYRRLQPLFEEAHEELGAADTTFTRTLQRAVVHLLETPIIERQPTVVPRASIFYEYTDPELESLSAAQKQLLVMGPDNVRAVQAVVRDLATALGLSDLPREPVVWR